jgi:hypothetical protein
VSNISETLDAIYFQEAIQEIIPTYIPGEKSPAIDILAKYLCKQCVKNQPGGQFELRSLAKVFNISLALYTFEPHFNQTWQVQVFNISGSYATPIYHDVRSDQWGVFKKTSHALENQWNTQRIENVDDPNRKEGYRRPFVTEANTKELGLRNKGNFSVYEYENFILPNIYFLFATHISAYLIFRRVVAIHSYVAIYLF